MTHQTKALQELPDKDAILIIAFGTTQEQARKAAIENIAAKIRAAYDGEKIVVAFTSHIVIRRIKEKEGILYDTPEEALEKLLKERFTRVAVITLDIIPGIEYAYKQKVFELYKEKFKKITLAVPLLYWMGQKAHADDVKNVFQEFFAEQKIYSKNFDAVLVFAHGTLHPANAYYSVIQDRLERLWKNHAYIYTVDGYPDLDAVIPKLKEKGHKKILLIPFMIVAGEHVCQDMAGESGNSHKAILEKEGFEVKTHLHGLGESEAICKFFLKRAEEAYNGLSVPAKFL
ncbi:sirohydrochlorin cobaltochelatase [Pectinatus haikarae]|uniref:Sirohydrochlorin cobaltochelatase n=1 Tax=Pectinatus haikarae TaxID=349096 RepID=A0ABT9Y527_9FIRM|nr:sirohydrochlorin cobaltochelatase [Pectinatus haikarae]MDQ0202738.1 sirohydrochlorin cobaltochelatase [Pectinatus haikarae]